MDALEDKASGVWGMNVPKFSVAEWDGSEIFSFIAISIHSYNPGVYPYLSTLFIGHYRFPEFNKKLTFYVDKGYKFSYIFTP